MACLDALAAFLSENRTERERFGTLPEPDAEGKRERERNGSQADAEPFAALTDAALVAHLIGEVEYLRAALTASQATANALTAELSEARKQSAVLIAATAGAFKAQDTPRIAAGDTDASTSKDGEQLTHAGTIDPCTVTKRPWWQVWGK